MQQTLKFKGKSQNHDKVCIVCTAFHGKKIRRKGSVEKKASVHRV